MRQASRRVVAAGVVLGLTGVVAPPGWSSPDPPSAAAVESADVNRTVTLLTGDRVTITSARDYVVEPGPGRKDVRFDAYRDDGHLHVVPADARPLIDSGTVDPRLFDVTTLLEFGYDDEGRSSLPLIVTATDAAGAATLGAGIRRAGGTATAALPAVDGSAVEVAKGEAGTFWRRVTQDGRTTLGAGGRIWLDGIRRLLLDQSVPQIGAPTAWKAGYTGEGVRVAVLDTGVDAAHPDLKGQVVASQNFTTEGNADTVGHGTHVASIIAGTGAASDGGYTGVAYDADVLSGKVCEGIGCADSDIIEGMQWAAAEMNAQIVNLSIGGEDTAQVDPVEAAVDTLTKKHGTLFVIAAGNGGPGNGTVTSPGSADAALAVGAVDGNDELADFSGRGPRVGDSGLKPEITAPGVDIVAAKASGTELGPPVGGQYVRLSGTSMATPHVAGVAALVAQRHPDWTAPRLKAVLTASAAPHQTLPTYAQGAGRVDAAQAINQTLTSYPVGLGIGAQLAAPGDKVSRHVKIRNLGPEPVTVKLTTEFTGPDGAELPADVFTVESGPFTIQPGKRTKVAVRIDIALVGAAGLYSGRIVGTAGKQTVQIPVALNIT